MGREGWPSVFVETAQAVWVLLVTGKVSGIYYKHSFFLFVCFLLNAAQIEKYFNNRSKDWPGDEVRQCFTITMAVAEKHLHEMLCMFAEAAEQQSNTNEHAQGACDRPIIMRYRCRYIQYIHCLDIQGLRLAFISSNQEANTDWTLLQWAVSTSASPAYNIEISFLRL